MAARRFCALGLVASLALAPAAAAKEHWTRAWTSSLWQGNERQVIAVENQTLRSEIRVGAGGEAIRVRLANDYGRMPVRVASVTVRGKPFDLLQVSIYLAAPTTLVGVHVDRANMLQISPAGDFTGTDGWSAAATSELRPLLAGIDVAGPRTRPVVFAFGDSITDATNCPNRDPAPCRWSEVLGRRLHAAGKPHVVVN